MAGAGFAALQQSWDYGQAMARLGARVLRLDLIQGAARIGQAQVLERRGLRLIGRGPVWSDGTDPDLQRRGLRRLARHRGPTLAMPELAVRGTGLMPLLTARHHAIWDLRPEPAALRAGLRANWRNHLTQAERLGLRFDTGGRDVLNQLIRAEAAQRRQRRYRALPGDFVHLWPGETLLMCWRDRGKVEAAMLFLIHGRTASYHLAWGSDRARAVFAHGAMLWHAALELRHLGLRELDLGEVNADVPGLALFKLGTGAAARPLGATMLVLPA